STPPASLAVDGVPYGMTPLMLRRPHGRHLVELSRPGFATISRWITVGNEPGDLRVALLKEEEKLDVTPVEKEEVLQVANERKCQTSSCYQHSLKRDLGLAGTVMLEVRVG